MSRRFTLSVLLVMKYYINQLLPQGKLDKIECFHYSLLYYRAECYMNLLRTDYINQLSDTRTNTEKGVQAE